MRHPNNYYSSVQERRQAVTREDRADPCWNAQTRFYELDATRCHAELQWRRHIIILAGEADYLDRRD